MAIAGDFFIDTGLGPFLCWFMPLLIVGVLIWNDVQRWRDRRRRQGH